MSQRYFDELKNSARNRKLNYRNKFGVHDTEWRVRTYKSAEQILSAVSFREHSHQTYIKTKSSLLPTIGFYYAVFHMGVAMLYLE